MDNYCVVLDMDGVVLDSENAKLSAFKDLFSAYPDKIELIDQYNKLNRGVPRKLKFEYVTKNILNLSLNDHFLKFLHEEYSQNVMQRMELVPLVNGIERFLQVSEFSFFLNSSAPIDEIKKILRMKGILHFFKDVFGYPSSKVDVLLNLKENLKNTYIVFFGDAIADYEAAKSSGVQFVAVCKSESYLDFEHLDVPVIKDFSNLDEIKQILKKS